MKSIMNLINKKRSNTAKDLKLIKSNLEKEYKRSNENSKTDAEFKNFIFKG